MWHFLALRYCVGDHFRAFGNYWAIAHACSLLCSAYRVCSCSLLFKAPHPHPPLSLYCLYSLIHYLLTRFSTFLPVQSAGAVFFWRAGLMAGLQVGWALGCSGCLDLGSAVPVHQYMSPYTTYLPTMFVGTQSLYVTKALSV